MWGPGLIEEQLIIQGLKDTNLIGSAGQIAVNFHPFSEKPVEVPSTGAEAKEGKLTLVSADGFRLATISLDYDDGEGQALVKANDLKRAKRARVSFQPSGESLDGVSLAIDTELTRYKWWGADGSFPDYEKLIPTEANVTAHLDTVEAGKAIASLKVLADRPIP